MTDTSADPDLDPDAIDAEAQVSPAPDESPAPPAEHSDVVASTARVAPETESEVVHAESQRFQLPGWARSVRFRLTLLYSVMLFGLASVLLGVIYWGLSRSLRNQQVAFNTDATRPVFDDLWQQDLDQQTFVVNQLALNRLQDYSFRSLIILFFASLIVGWFVAGRVLYPIGYITRVARDIQATDLSRRIGMRGPDDELKQLADTFDGMLARLDHAFAGQRRLIHEASHELRNPLAVIRTNLEVTMTDPGAELEDYKHTADVVQRNAERMTRLVDDLLTYARQDAEPGEHEPVDITELVVGLGDEFAPPAQKEGLQLAVEATPGLWANGDAASLEQAMSNLLSNAVRLAPEGTALDISAGQEQGWVWMAVEDQGPGIAKADAERVFQRGHRDRSSTGSGLGLAIVRQIAEAHKGEVRLRSEPGRGARFAIWLPALVPSDPTKETHELKLTSAG